MDDLNKAIDDFIAEQDEASARNDYEYAEMIRVLRLMKATRFLLGLLAERRRAGKLVGHGEKEELLQAEIERLRGLLSPDFTGRVDDKERARWQGAVRALEDTLGRAHAERLAAEQSLKSLRDEHETFEAWTREQVGAEDGETTEDAFRRVENQYRSMVDAINAGGPVLAELAVVLGQRRGHESLVDAAKRVVSENEFLSEQASKGAALSAMLGICGLPDEPKALAGEIERERASRASDFGSVEIANAIDLSRRAVFSPGREPTEEEETKHVGAVYGLALATKRPIRLRSLQKRGVSSRHVAEALRLGVLVFAGTSDDEDA